MTFCSITQYFYYTNARILLMRRNITVIPHGLGIIQGADNKDRTDEISMAPASCEWFTGGPLGLPRQTAPLRH
jgi:hypothetical protein